jgi:hypothetical protein
VPLISLVNQGAPLRYRRLYIIQTSRSRQRVRSLAEACRLYLQAC